MVLCDKKYNFLVFFLFFLLESSADFLSSNFTSEGTLFTRVSGKPLSCRRDLKCLTFS